MARTTSAAESQRQSRLLTLAAIVIVVAALYLARDILIPLALATLLSFLLTPLVLYFERFRLPRVAAVLVTVVIAFGILGGIGYVVYFQLADLASQLPRYRDSIHEKVESIRSGGGFFTDVKRAGEDLLAPTTKPATTESAATTQAAAPLAARLSAAERESLPSNNLEGRQSRPPATRPIPVFVTNRTDQINSAPIQLIEDLGTRILGPVGTAFIVVVFTIFILLQREDLRDRLIRLVGRSRLTVTTEALSDAASRVSRYLLMQSLINGAVGVAVMASLWAIGKLNGRSFPNPALFGMLSGLLRFIPYIGIWVSAVMPLLLSLAAYAGVKAALETLIAYIAIEIIAANVLEPLLFGSSTGITTLAVLVAAAFWAWLWGPVGLLLSTPMTVCVVVIGKYVPQLSFLNILLADEPALQPPDRIYQRLLALDEEEAERLVDEYARRMPLEEVYDDVLLPALAMAEHDHSTGNLDEERLESIHRGMRDLVEDLGDRHRAQRMREGAKRTVEQSRSDVPSGNGQPPPPPPEKPAAGDNGSTAIEPAGLAQPPEGYRLMLPQGCAINVICLPASNESDAIAATMFAQLLEFRGYCTAIVSVEKLASEMVGAVERFNADIACISATPPAAVPHARYLCKRLHARQPEMKMLVGLWTSREEVKRSQQRIRCTSDMRVLTNLRDALQQIHQMVQPKLVEQTSAREAAAQAR
jgi:predicted PurR-regulated permease PerM